MREAAVTRIFSLLAAAAWILAAMTPAQAQQSYNSPDEAFAALVAAAKADDNRALIRVLGAGALDIVSSGDEVADQTRRQTFLSAYDARHEISTEGNTATLLVGTDRYPLPIPLIKKNDSWQFDAVAAREEILFRRIGRNELDAIQASLAYVDAQNEFAQQNRKGPFAVYAQRIVSEPGKRNGLYWPAAAGETESPLGELVAQASSEGYHGGEGRAPYHGYYYKILTRQGPTAPGGAMSYVVNGDMIGGFALVAYPAQYGNSGVMTFVVNHQGTVFQKDLGPRTEQLASRMTQYNPDHTWKKAAASDTAQ
jgi:hypothetical protein